MADMLASRLAASRAATLSRNEVLPHGDDPVAADALAGGVKGGVRLVLRLEGLIVLMASVAAYAQLGAGWGAFAMLFLLPDLSFLGYLASARVGAVAYNAAHSYIGPVALLAYGVLTATPTAVAAALIWCAHIGFDRALGYGLKYGTEFGATHLGRVGRTDPW